MTALWTVETMAAAMRARMERDQGKWEPVSRPVARANNEPASDEISGISIDTRTLRPGEAFFAISGDSRDGHEFVGAAMKAGAAAAVVAAGKRGELPKDGRYLIVDDVLDGLRDLAKAARARTDAKVIGVTGSVGKTSTKEALHLALSREGPTHASAASYNNHWGVPLSLARCPQQARFAVFEMGMNHAGEIGPLSKLVQPHIAIITTIAPVHLEYFRSVDDIADAKAEIFEGLVPGRAAILNCDNAQFGRLVERARTAKVGRIVSFGEDAKADARLIDCGLQPASSTVRASILGQNVAYKLGAPGKHLVLNSLAALAAAKLAGADLAVAALALADLKPASGRGTRIELNLPGGPALLIDESYNANPVSMRAALDLLGQAAPGPRGRRIAVLGDMLELGSEAADLHRALVEPVVANDVDLVFCSGPAMRNLWQALPSDRRGGYAEDSKGLEPQVLDAVRGGDAIMVKGSNGSKMAPIVKSLQRSYAPADAHESASA